VYKKAQQNTITRMASKTVYIPIRFKKKRKKIEKNHQPFFLELKTSFWPMYTRQCFHSQHIALNGLRINSCMAFRKHFSKACYTKGSKGYTALFSIRRHLNLILNISIYHKYINIITWQL